jgi:hypothetical protein
MTLRDNLMIPDTAVYTAMRVSRQHGRRRLEELKAKDAVRPVKTPTGRNLLSIADAERLAAAL